MILVLYWIATLIALKGSHEASKVTKYGFLLGTLLPGIFIVVLGVLWVIKGNPIQFLNSGLFSGTVSGMHARYFPNVSNLGNLAFLAGIILLFAGVEVHAVHANDMKDPSKEFPISILIASLIIFFLFTLGSLAVAAVIPAKEISLTAGLLQAFKQILTKFNIDFLTPIVGLFLAFGAVGSVMSWVDGPSKGLLHTAKEGELPPFLAKVNKQGMQQNILIVQALIVTVLASLYFFMKNVSVAFFLLSAMTISLYLVMYVLLYTAGIKLKFSKPQLKRPFKVPGGLPGFLIFSGIGLAGVLFALLVSFFPPTILPVGNPQLYISLVAAGLIVFVGLPLWISTHKKPSWKKKGRK